MEFPGHVWDSLVWMWTAHHPSIDTGPREDREDDLLPLTVARFLEISVRTYVSVALRRHRVFTGFTP